MSDGVRVRLSGGFVALAVLHAVLLGLVFASLQSEPTDCPAAGGCGFPIYDPPAPMGAVVEKLPEPPEVNLQAQGELKQQYCPPCNSPSQTGSRLLPRVVNRTVVHRTASSPQPANSTAAPAAKPTGGMVGATPATNPVTPPRSPFVTAPAGNSTIVAPSQTPPKKDYQLALFVGSDAQSKRLVEWFDNDPELARLRVNCEFQVYTAGNPLYQTRFKEIVPADQFPVVLFQDSTGGHIHAAGRAMIPTSATELHADLQHGYELYHQAMQAQKTGAIKERGYSWDDTITPTMSLFSQDCPVGYCPVEPQDRWRPGSRVRDTLFDGVRDSRNAFIRASANELATIALSVIAVLLLGFILFKKGIGF